MKAFPSLTAPVRDSKRLPRIIRNYKGTSIKYCFCFWSLSKINWFYVKINILPFSTIPILKMQTESFLFLCSENECFDSTCSFLRKHLILTLFFQLKTLLRCAWSSSKGVGFCICCNALPEREMDFFSIMFVCLVDS